MKILEPNTGNKVQAIYKNHVFAAITDYELLLLLIEVRVKFGEQKSTWIWMKLKEGSLLTVGSGEREYSSFDHAINKMVNDPYCTVYDCESYAEMMRLCDIGELEYKETISTVYKGKEE